jgi:hypothetical protein
MIFKRNNVMSCVPFKGFYSFKTFSFDVLCRSDHGRLQFHDAHVHGRNRSVHWNNSVRSSCLLRKENERVY